MAANADIHLTVGEERVTTGDVTKGEAIDLKARDPEQLHENMKMAESEVKLTIGEDKVTTVDVTKGAAVDLKARDPEHLHDHVRVQFHDIFGEPDETVFSFDFVWTWAFKLFTNTKLWCYRITSLICGLPLAIYWGIHFALLSFCAIWCCEPYLKVTIDIPVAFHYL
ncbi:CAV1-like protein [Mya arenaria]|uniref:Caveolin n=1 Tax=Mya arenaria TaxID=6604 RepID=A0ABY7G2A8_MYAAR|nr:CAV1-like protein [Mya arenaria]